MAPATTVREQDASTVRRFSILAAVALALVSPPSAGAQERALEPDVRMHSAVPSKFLAKPRDVMVWLPPGYGTEGEKRYPVLYLQDGANVYIEWRVDEVAKPLIASQQIEPLIIVLVPNGGGPEDRYYDYTPTRPANARAGGKADAYGRFLVEELKPFIDREYRTLKDPASTGLGVLHSAVWCRCTLGSITRRSSASWPSCRRRCGGTTS